ncbi:MAG: shikimate dehydrogenase [Oscillospiraceae bacterium]|nr:shikimate dehydrogenase [Oscillospiraceae bacterium]
MQYGCIGEHLTHSFSKIIHGELASYDYELREIPMGELDAFMTAREFRAINVTMPYKQAVIPYLKEVEAAAAAIGAVNTVVNREGQLYGYNTDFGGMAALIRRSGIPLEGKKVLIFGSGGTSHTAMAVAEHLGAGEVYRVSRTGKGGALTYEEVKSAHLDAQILINTTPRGMFSRETGMAIDPALFPHLAGAVDAVYNPLRSEFVLAARKKGARAVGGLYMLVAQAVLASEIFLGAPYPEDTIERVYRTIKSGKENIVLTGMPGSGKSTVGKLLSEKLGRPYFDVDECITEKTGKTPAELITAEGEAAFRDIESEVIGSLASETGAVIATGGGAVLREENVDALRMNGKLFFLDRPVELLCPTADRPLSSTKETIFERYNERYARYISTADVVIANEGTPQQAAQLVERNF